MKAPRNSWWAVLLVLAAPSLAWAQSGSVDTPNTTAAAPCGADQNVPGAGLPADPKMKVRIKAANPGGLILPQVNADPVTLVGCDNALTVANKEMDRIHTAALAAGYTCSALSGTCGGAVAGGTAEQIWRYTASGEPCGFTLTKDFGAATNSIRVSGMAPGCLPRGVGSSTNSGNPLGLDLLPQVLLQVNPNGVHGIVTFRAFHIQGGQNPRSFTVNTGTHGSNLVALHTAISSGFANMGLGFQTSVESNANHSQFPADYGSISLVRISNAQQATRIEVTTVPGQLLQQETSYSAVVPPVPGISPWGVSLLFVALLLLGYWVLQRRQRMAVAP